MKLRIVSLATVLITLSGCASNDGLEQQVSTLSNKVDKLTTEVSRLKAQQAKQQMALDELAKQQESTDQKLSNISSSFKK